MNDLDAQLIAAHVRGDHQTLVSLYSDAADAAGTEEARGFFLTQAMVMALECGDPRTNELRLRLVEMGREAEF